jgi:hypothetical protein
MARQTLLPSSSSTGGTIFVIPSLLISLSLALEYAVIDSAGRVTLFRNNNTVVCHDGTARCTMRPLIMSNCATVKGRYEKVTPGFASRASYGTYYQTEIIKNAFPLK